MAGPPYFAMVLYRAFPRVRRSPGGNASSLCALCFSVMQPVCQPRMWSNVAASFAGHIMCPVDVPASELMVWCPDYEVPRNAVTKVSCSRHSWRTRASNRRSSYRSECVLEVGGMVEVTDVNDCR